MRPFDELLADAVAFHGHLCPGQVLGVRMAIEGCRALGINEPKTMGKSLLVAVEIDRCATDAIQSVTGCSLGKRTLRFLDYGKMAATFVSVIARRAVRVVARDDARERAGAYAPGVTDPRQAQLEAYRAMPAVELLRVRAAAVRPEWLDRRRVRVFCRLCGEGVNYGREVVSDGLTLCRPCFAAHSAPGTAPIEIGSPQTVTHGLRASNA